MKRVAGYSRISRVGPRGGDSFRSPVDQAKAIRAHAKARGLRLVEIADERDVSGGTMARPELRRLIDKIRAGQLEGIVVARLDRFARTLVGGIQALEEIHAAGGFVQTVEGGIDTSTSGGAMGDLQLNLLLTLAQWERAVRAEGFESAKQGAVDRGVHIAGTVPVGYLRQGKGMPLVVDDAKAFAVTEAFRLRAAGSTLSQVGSYLDGAIPGGPSSKGGWARNSVARLLANPVYTGQARQGVHRKEGAHPALVAPDTFRLAGAMATTDSRTPSERATKSLLAGLVACGACGHALDRNTVGGKYLVYRCRAHSAEGDCREPTSVMVATLDEYVTEAALARLDSFRAKAVQADDATGGLRARLAAAVAKRAPFEDADYVAVLGMQAARRALVRVDKEIEALESELANVTRSANAADLPDAASAREHWPSLTVPERRQILSAMIEAVFVNRGDTRRTPVQDRANLVWAGEILPLDRPSRGRRRDNHEVEAGMAAA